MMQRLLEQRQVISLVSAELKIPAELSSLQSSEDVTVSEVTPDVNTTIRKLQMSALVGSCLHGMLNDLLSSLPLCYAKMEKEPIYAVSTLLDARLKANVFTNHKNVAAPSLI
ncbi:hypothetical protein PR048_016846 [Dryococelus australis]|uniref:Uncharacterized protein n=1 Tax=Dryococelus australis TaxID=614101 RepID=A0ABQ9H7Y4_9NEOP|nr:hypothetical protein PR048_016846 [Dryococelus australis]